MGPESNNTPGGDVLAGLLLSRANMNALERGDRVTPPADYFRSMRVHKAMQGYSMHCQLS